MQRQNNTTQQPLTVTIAHHKNTGNICEGDRVTYQPADTYEDGELVVLECCTGGRWRTAYLFNAKGKRYRYYIKPEKHTSYGSGREMLYGDGDDWIVRGIVRKVRSTRRSKRPEAKQQKGQAKRSIYRAGFDWSYFGVHRGDVLIVKETTDVKPGQLVYAKYDDEDEGFFNRVCCVTGDTVRLASDALDSQYDKDRALLVGRVVEIRHDDCNHTRIEALRAKIAELQTSDDPISHTSKCYELEKQIFALEHPPEESDEDDVSDEWPDELDG